MRKTEQRRLTELAVSNIEDVARVMEQLHKLAIEQGVREDIPVHLAYCINTLDQQVRHLRKTLD